MIRRAFAPAAALVLAGCVTQPRPPAHVDLQTACAPDITAMTAHALRPAAAAAKGERPKPAPLLDFADVGQCVAAADGKIPAALFRFEDVRPPLQVSLTITAESAATLAAAVTLLDDHHQPLRRYGFEQFSRRGNTYTLDVFVNARDAAPTYLLLSPDAAWVGKEDAGLRAGSRTYAAYGPVFFAYNVGYEERRNRQLSDAGRLQIEVRAAAP